MRALGWFEVGLGATEEEVRHLEEDFRCRFPADAAAFLSSHAGASNPDESEFDVVEPSGRRRVGNFGSVLRVSGDGIDSVRATALALEGLPPTLIPIIGTGSGDYVCLELDDGSARAVVYYMHERPLADCVVPLAASLTDFLSKLRTPDD
jgi:cell wall assembly regulator SMI1